MPPLKNQISSFAQELTILFVEDDAATRLMIATQLRGMFKEVILAANGEEGLQSFWRQSPQIVITDDQMPVRSGIAMTEAIRSLDSKVPIIFITASMDTALLVRAINLGISSFLPKPVAPENLRQAVALVVGQIEHDHLQQKNIQQELALLQYRERYHEVQQELAFRKELSILQNDFSTRSFGGGIGSDRGEWVTQVVYQPHDIMCGDSFSLRKLPDGSLLIFLADAMGKGLAASLTTSLSVYAFNLQVDTLVAGEPFEFQPFIQRYTTLLSKRLLEDEVFSLCLGWFPAAGATLETATFGMPPILIGTPGGPIRKLRSNNPPVSAYTEEFRTTSHDLAGAQSLLIYTDGLNESDTGDGTLYRDHLDADFQAIGSAQQLQEVFQTRVTSADDDVTFLLLSRVDAPLIWSKAWTLASRLGEVEQTCLDIERRLEACTGLEPGPRAEFAMAIREALFNAYEHGSLGLSGLVKLRLVEEGTYLDHLLERESEATWSIQVGLSVQVEGRNHLLKVAIQDEGSGFTPPASINESNNLTACGRGLRMVKKYTDFFYFNDKGNAITLIKIYRGGSDATGAQGYD